LLLSSTGFPQCGVAWPVLKYLAMKVRNSTCKKLLPRKAARHDQHINLPRIYLFLELFVEKEIPGRSTK